MAGSSRDVAMPVGWPAAIGPAVIAEVGLLANRALRNGRRGRIAAVFERSLYAVFGHDWVCIGLAEIGSGPLHVLCNTFAPAEFSVGQEIAVIDGMLIVGDGRLARIDNASIWTPQALPRWTSHTLCAGLLAVDEAWHVAPTEEGLAAAGCAQLPAPASLVFASAVPHIAALTRSIEGGLRGQRPAAGDETGFTELIGLGPGLTPSGDDLLGGALIALASLGRLKMRDGLWNALRPHLHRTNDISAAHLRSAAQGYAAAALHVAINATMSGAIDRVAPALKAVASVGHSSGRDAFAGALIVLRAAARAAAAGLRPVAAA